MANNIISNMAWRIIQFLTFSLVILFLHYIGIFSIPAYLFIEYSVTRILLIVLSLIITANVVMKDVILNGMNLNLPGPQPLLFLGTSWQFCYRYSMNKLHDAYADMFKRYGTVFAEFSATGTMMVSIADRAALETILRSPSKWPYRPPTEIVQAYRISKPNLYASTGLVNEQGEKWFHLRSNLTTELKSPQFVQGCLPELNIISDDFMALLVSSRQPDGTIHAFDQLTNRMGLESVCQLMLGNRVGFLEQRMSGRATALTIAVKAHFRAQRDSFYGAPLWKFLPTTLYKTFVKSEETIQKIITELIDEANLENQNMAQDNGMSAIFIQIQNNPHLDRRDKKAAMIDFITAGIETLANTLVFLLYLLSRRPDWQRRIYDELPSITMLSVEQFANAPSMKAAINEAFRLLPTAPLLARMLETPLTVDGHVLPARTMVLCHTGAACRREENFWKANEYLPERWMEVREPHAAALVAPFGKGKRMCPGKRFVELELNVLLAKVLQKWRVEYIGELDVEFDFLLSPKAPVSLRFLEW